MKGYNTMNTNRNTPPMKGFYILFLFLVLMMAFSVLACDDNTGRYDGDKGTNIIQIGYEHIDTPDCFGKGESLGLCETGKEANK